MIAHDRYRKQPKERERLAIDFKNRLPNGDALSNINGCRCTLNGVDVTQELIEAPQIADETRVVFWCKNGQSGKLYKLTILVESTSGFKIEEDLLIEVREA